MDDALAFIAGFLCGIFLMWIGYWWIYLRKRGEEG